MTATATAIDWFPDWLEFHRKLFPSQHWNDPNTDDGWLVYQGWVETFERIGADDALARAASRRMQARDDNPMPHRHLGILKEIIADLKRGRELERSVHRIVAEPPPEVRAALHESAGCPECTAPVPRVVGGAVRAVDEPSGLARRLLAVRGLPVPMAVNLYCRCAVGRYLLWRDRERRSGPVQWDDLQARPDLWDRRLSHPSWADVPAAPWAVIVRPGDPDARYLRPDERPAPGPTCQSAPGAGAGTATTGVTSVEVADSGQPPLVGNRTRRFTP